MLQKFPKWQFLFKISGQLYFLNTDTFLFFFLSLFKGHGKDHIDGHHSVLQIASRRYGTENKCISAVELLEAARIEETMQMKKRSNKPIPNHINI